LLSKYRTVSKYMRKCNFIYANKRMIFSSPRFTRLINAEHQM
jgi:hypothetical protein